MGNCAAGHHSKFVVKCSAKIKDLFDYYTQIVLYLRTSNFFATTTDPLLIAIDLYLANDCQFHPSDIPLAAVDSAHKLHPLDYRTETVTKEWLLKACLRQHRFVSDFPIQLLSFDACYNIYVQFLHLCYCSPEEVIMPSKEAKFMWHAHMLNHKAYIKDMSSILGRVLNHRDDFREESEQHYMVKTTRLRKQRYSSNIKTIIEGHYNGQEEVKRKSQEQSRLKSKEQSKLRGTDSRTVTAGSSYRMSGIRGNDSSLRNQAVTVYKLNDSGLKTSGLAQQKLGSSGLRRSGLEIELRPSEIRRRERKEQQQCWGRLRG